MNTQNKNTKHTRSGRVAVPDLTLWICAFTLVVTSAIWTKERGSLPGLAQIETVNQVEPIEQQDQAQASIPMIELTPATPIESIATEADTAEPLDPAMRWFDGKMIRPARVIYMTVTGYSPDERSCGKFADNKTATMYSVWTNGMNLVAADPTVLPYWSMVSIPGYANADIVPVLDCGGAIKGNRIDLLYPTHELARQWGVRSLPVTVWEFVGEE